MVIMAQQPQEFDHLGALINASVVASSNTVQFNWVAKCPSDESTLEIINESDGKTTGLNVVRSPLIIPHFPTRLCKVEQLS